MSIHVSLQALHGLFDQLGRQAEKIASPQSAGQVAKELVAMGETSAQIEFNLAAIQLEQSLFRSTIRFL